MSVWASRSSMARRRTSKSRAPGVWVATAFLLSPAHALHVGGFYLSHAEHDAAPRTHRASPKRVIFGLNVINLLRCRAARSDALPDALPVNFLEPPTRELLRI